MTKSRFEKILWIFVLIGCIGGAVCAWFGRYFNPVERYFQISVILSLVAIFIITLSFFYFNKQLNREVDPIFAPTYILLVLYTVVVVLQYLGVINLGLLSEDSKTLWMGVPVLAMIWETRLIWGSIQFGNRK